MAGGLLLFITKRQYSQAKETVFIHGWLS